MAIKSFQSDKDKDKETYRARLGGRDIVSHPLFIMLVIELDHVPTLHLTNS